MYRLQLIGWAVIVALQWPALGHTEPSDQELVDRYVADSQKDERAIVARLSGGGAWLGDDSLAASAAFAPFVAVAAQVDFWVQPRYSLHVLGTYGHLVGPAEYPNVPCPRSSAQSTCTANAQRAALWSSLAFGATWMHEKGPRTLHARGDLGILIRRHSHGRLLGRGSSTGQMTFHPLSSGPFAAPDWHVSPVANVAAGAGYRIHPMWVAGLEVELQLSAPLGTPFYATTALNLVFHRHWDP